MLFGETLSGLALAGMVLAVGGVYMAGVTAVSYTHLDVYKRQLLQIGNIYIEFLSMQYPGVMLEVMKRSGTSALKISKPGRSRLSQGV